MILKWDKDKKKKQQKTKATRHDAFATPQALVEGLMLNFSNKEDNE